MTQSRQLFGTDGIRGVAGEFPLSKESTYVIGRALGHDLVRSNSKARVVIGQDTRESSTWIADRVTAGLASVGVHVESAGVITTPGVAYLARAHHFDAGVVISASHNPWTDNGIKVFSGTGYKLPDTHELAIEKEIFTILQRGDLPVPGAESSAASIPGESSLRQDYIQWLLSNIRVPVGSLRVLVDCANGAAAAEAPELFRSCGVDATIIHATPDGRNINENCGALHPDTVATQMVKSQGHYDLGVTFDGDADRALFCDAEGNVINGDAVLLLAARDLRKRNALPTNTVVATTMSNMGVEAALKKSGIRMLRANVGDKYVLEEMQRTGACLGGEQSGHIIFRDGEATTGDGLLTALRVMEIMVSNDKSLAELVEDLKVFPQTIQNVRVREKVPLKDVPAIQKVIAEAESDLDGNGRIVVRYSGTESLARVMVEAESEEKVRRVATTITDALRVHLGE
jgi:phosphoglucosamine mutase